MNTDSLIDIAATISRCASFSHIESPLILKICEAYEILRKSDKQSDAPLRSTITYHQPAVYRRSLENIKHALNNSRAYDEALHTIENEVSWALSHSASSEQQSFKPHYHKDAFTMNENASLTAFMPDKTREIPLLDPDMPTQELRLHMGELKANEVLVARAAIAWANTRQIKPVSIKDGADAVKGVFDLSLVGPDSGFKPQDVAEALAKRWRLPYVD